MKVKVNKELLGVGFLPDSLINHLSATEIAEILERLNSPEREEFEKAYTGRALQELEKNLLQADNAEERLERQIEADKQSKRFIKQITKRPRRKK